MTDDISVARRLGLIILLDVLLVAAVAAALYTNPEFLSRILPGLFGFSTSMAFTGNYFAGALILLLTGILILLASFFSLLSRLSRGVLIGPAQLRNWLQDDAAVSRLTEEQTHERQRFGSLHRFFLFGALLFFVGSALTAFTYAKANPAGMPIFENETGVVANNSVTLPDAALFTLDQVIGGVAIGMPDHYDLRTAKVTFNTGSRWVMASAMTLRVVSLLIGLMILFALSRGRALKSYIAGAGAAVAMTENPAAPHVAPAEEVAPEAEHEAAIEAAHHPAQTEDAGITDLHQEDALPPQPPEEHHAVEAAPEPEISHPGEHEAVAEAGPAHHGEHEIAAEAEHAPETHGEHVQDDHAPHGKHAAE